MRVVSAQLNNNAHVTLMMLPATPLRGWLCFASLHRRIAGLGGPEGCPEDAEGTFDVASWDASIPGGAEGNAAAWGGSRGPARPDRQGAHKRWGLCGDNEPCRCATRLQAGERVLEHLLLAGVRLK